MWGNIFTEVSYIQYNNMSFLDQFLYLKSISHINYNLTYVNTG
jgi:hypothetical protein